MFTWKINKWTSDLIISADIELTEDIKNKIIELLDYIESCYSKFNKTRSEDVNHILNPLYKKWGLNDDYNCMLKGVAIDYIKNILEQSKSISHVISFGGDIYGNVPLKCPIEGTDFSIEVDGVYSIFTSGNTEKRGHHILKGDWNALNVVVVNWLSINGVDNALVDILSTKCLAKENYFELITEYMPEFYKLGVYSFDLNQNKLLNKTYIASPFFNPTQVEIRDRMASKFKYSFRPDLTESAKKYDGNHGNDDFVNDVVEDNERGIRESQCLVFPNRTTDLGTLYEVGYAIAKGKHVIKFDEDSNKYTILFNLPSPLITTATPMLFDCSDKRSAIALGYASAIHNSKDIFYQLKGCPDNIMLSVKYNHIEIKDGKYVKIERNKSDRDS